MVPDWDVFLGERLAMTQDWATRLGADVLGGEASPMLPLSSWASWDDYLAALSRKLRLKIRHDERALASRHRLSYRATGDPAELPADLDRFFSLHRARWRDGQSSFEPREEFHRRFAALALDRGWLRLWFLELDDQAVATQYDFAYGGVYSSYNTGRDPEWDKRGVGLVLRAHTIREALASGAAEYRFLRGGELYKQRYLTEDAGLVTIGLARTWRGRRSLSVGRLLGGNPRLRGVI